MTGEPSTPPETPDVNADGEDFCDVLFEDHGVRLYSNLAVAFLKRGVVDILLLKEEDRVTSVGGSSDPRNRAMVTSPHTSEIGRVSMFPGAALSLAIDILTELAPTGGVNVDLLRDKTEELLKIAEEAEKKKGLKL